MPVSRVPLELLQRLGGEREGALAALGLALDVGLLAELGIALREPEIHGADAGLPLQHHCSGTPFLQSRTIGFFFATQSAGPRISTRLGITTSAANNGT